MKKLSIFGLIHSNNNLDAINKFYKEFFIEVSKNFTNFYVIDLSNLIFFKKGKSRKAKINKFPKNFIFFKPKNLSELKKFLNKYNLIAVNNIGKNPDFFWVLFWLKKLNVKLINIIYSGVFGLSTTINIFENNWSKLAKFAKVHDTSRSHSFWKQDSIRDCRKELSIQRNLSKLVGSSTRSLWRTVTGVRILTYYVRFAHSLRTFNLVL